MTLERSHGKARLTRPRLRAVRLPTPGGAEPPSAHARSHRAGLRALHMPLLAAAKQTVGSALGTDATPAVGAEVALQALTLYRSARRELGSRSPIVVASILRWALQTAISQHLSLAAASAGPATELGQRLIERAHAADGRSERAILAAVTLAGALETRSPRGVATDDLARLLREAAKPRESTS